MPLANSKKFEWIFLQKDPWLVVMIECKLWYSSYLIYRIQQAEVGNWPRLLGKAAHSQFLKGKLLHQGTDELAT
jgi:hypothetical protein